MKHLNLPWVAFWLGLFAFLMFCVFEMATHPYHLPTLSSVDQCAKNNGVPIYNTWGTMTDCKIYLKK